MTEIEEKFWDRVEPEPNTGCWLWVGSIGANGYGHFYPESYKPMALAHRWSYENYVGPISDGLDGDHKCRMRRCANHAHIEPVTRKENRLRAVALITHCPVGHPYDEENTAVRNGKRSCRTCHRDRMRRMNRIYRRVRTLVA